MALDIADQLLPNQDVHLVKTDKYRAYNLLYHAGEFTDNPGIGLNIPAMVEAGITDNALEYAVVNYLCDFGCDLRKISITASRGTIHMNMDFGGHSVYT